MPIYDSVHPAMSLTSVRPVGQIWLTLLYLRVSRKNVINHHIVFNCLAFWGGGGGIKAFELSQNNSDICRNLIRLSRSNWFTGNAQTVVRWIMSSIVQGISDRIHRRNGNGLSVIDIGHDKCHAGLGQPPTRKGGHSRAVQGSQHVILKLK